MNTETRITPDEILRIKSQIISFQDIINCYKHIQGTENTYMAGSNQAHGLIATLNMLTRKLLQVQNVESAVPLSTMEARLLFILPLFHYLDPPVPAYSTIPKPNESTKSHQANGTILCHAEETVDTIPDTVEIIRDEEPKAERNTESLAGSTSRELQSDDLSSEDEIYIMEDKDIGTYAIKPTDYGKEECHLPRRDFPITGSVLDTGPHRIEVLYDNPTLHPSNHALTDQEWDQVYTIDAEELKRKTFRPTETRKSLMSKLFRPSDGVDPWEGVARKTEGGCGGRRISDESPSTERVGSTFTGSTCSPIEGVVHKSIEADEKSWLRSQFQFLYNSGKNKAKRIQTVFRKFNVRLRSRSKRLFNIDKF